MSKAQGIAQSANQGQFKNRIINGAMMIDQRNAGASVTLSSGSTYTLDRWNFELSQSSKISVQQNAGSVTPPAGFTKYLGITSLSAYSVGSGDYFSLRQNIEGYNIADFAWGTASAKTITVSFWVRSSLTGTFGGAIKNGDSDYNYPFSYTISAANTWEQKSITITPPTAGSWNATNSTGLQLYIGLGTGSTYGSGTAGAWTTSNFVTVTGATSVVGTNGATFYITGVQLEKGSTATSFDYRPYGTELQLCYRYYYKYLNDRGGPTWAIPFQAYNTTSAFGKLFDLPVTMRSLPTCTAVGTFSALNSTGSITSAYTNVNIDYPTSQAVMTGGWTGSSGLTAGNMTLVYMTSGSYIQASAEL